jgi:hypothetical protein
MTTSKNIQIGIGAIVKENAAALLEWIAYHRVVGIEHFWIADNGCGAAARQLLLDLHRLGIINYIYFPSRNGQGAQLPAYKKIVDCTRNFDGVLAIIDADEFLVPEGDSLVPYVEERFRDEGVSAVALNWACFGSSGALFADDGLVIERFTQRAKKSFKPNLQIKSIVRPQRVKEFINPHFATLFQGRYTDAAGNTYRQGLNSGVSAGVSWEGARVNHYIVKSLEEFLAGKHLSGSVATPNKVKHKKYFIDHDRNDEECLLAARFAPQVHAEISRINDKRDQLLSCLHPAHRKTCEGPKNTGDLEWMHIPGLNLPAGGVVADNARTPILHDQAFKQRWLLEELSCYIDRLLRSSQYRLGSTIGSLIRALMGKKEKRSLPEIKIRHALEVYERLKKTL